MDRDRVDEPTCDVNRQHVVNPMPTLLGVDPRLASHFADSLWRWRWLSATILVAAGVVGVYYVGVKGERRSAINRWRPVLHALARGEDIYLRYGFPTPPFMALVLYPFSLLPGAWTMTAWFVAKVAMTIIVVIWLLEMLERLGFRLSAWSAGAMLAFAAGPIVADLVHGNVNLWVLFLVTAAWRAFSLNRDFTGGSLLALAIASKLTPLLLLLFLVWKRAWKAIAGCLVGLVVAGLIAPGALLGHARNVELLRHWADYMVWPYLDQGKVETRQTNQSLPALIHRLTTPCVAVEPETGPPATINWLDLTASHTRRLVTATTILVLGALAAVCRTAWADRSGVSMVHEFCLVLIAMVLISERSWKHHFVVLLPSFMLLTATAVKLTATPAAVRRGRSVALSVVLAWLAITATSQDLVELIWGAGAAKLLQAYGTYTWSAILLASTHVRCLIRRPTTR
jgi:hypothetical protein